MKTEKFIATFSATNSTCKLSQLENMKEIYYRIFFNSGIIGLAHSYADSINKPTPIEFVNFIIENIRIITTPKIGGYTDEQKSQLLELETDKVLRKNFSDILIAQFSKIWAGEKMNQDFWEEEEFKSQLLQRMDSFDDDDLESKQLYLNGLDIEYCPPAVYEDLFRYMGEQIDKAKQDFRNDEIACLEFIKRVVKLMFKNAFKNTTYCTEISLYLFHDLLLNYPTTNFPGKTVSQVKGSDLSRKVIQSNTEKVDDSYLDSELQQVIQQQKIRQQQEVNQITNFEIPNKAKDLIGKVLGIYGYDGEILYSGFIKKISSNSDTTIFTIDSGRKIECDTFNLKQAISNPDYDTDCLRFDTSVDGVIAVIPYGETVYNLGDAGFGRQQQQEVNHITNFEIPNKTYIRKNGTVCKMIFCGAYAMGELYPANLNQGKRVAGKYMTIPFKATKNTISQFPTKKILKVNEDGKTLYRYATGDESDFYQFCEDCFDMIKEPRAMWEVR